VNKGTSGKKASAPSKTPSKALSKKKMRKKGPAIDPRIAAAINKTFKQMLGIR
jgi:hypothetical protein